MPKFTANNQTIGDLIQRLGSLVPRIDKKEWDENIFFAIQKGLPLKPITFTKTLVLSNDSNSIAKMTYEIIDGEETLSTIFSYIESDIFKEKEPAIRVMFWNCYIGTNEIKEPLTDAEKELIRYLMNK